MSGRLAAVALLAALALAQRARAEPPPRISLGLRLRAVTTSAMDRLCLRAPPRIGRALDRLRVLSPGTMGEFVGRRIERASPVLRACLAGILWLPGGALLDAGVLALADHLRRSDRSQTFAQTLRAMAAEYRTLAAARLAENRRVARLLPRAGLRALADGLTSNARP